MHIIWHIEHNQYLYERLMCVCWFVCCNEGRLTGAILCIATQTMRICTSCKKFVNVFFATHFDDARSEVFPKKSSCDYATRPTTQIRPDNFCSAHPILNSGFPLLAVVVMCTASFVGMQKNFHIFIDLGFPFVCLSVDIWAKPDRHRASKGLCRKQSYFSSQ